MAPVDFDACVQLKFIKTNFQQKLIIGYYI